MNTLVDPKDGAIPVPETRDGNAPGPGDAAVAPGSSAATLIELAPPHGETPEAVAAATATLVELAPESGRTLILPEGPSGELKRALAERLPAVAAAPAKSSSALSFGGSARRWLARVQGLAGGRAQPRLKRLAPLAVGVASLLATGIPFWLRSPRPPGAVPATADTVRIAPSSSSPLTFEYPDERSPDRAADLAGAPDQPAETASATAIAAPRDGARPAGPRLAGDRRGRTHAAVNARWKSQGRGWVLRTRNGSPVVE